MPSRQKPDGTVAGSSKRLASRLYQLKTSLPHRAVPTVDEEPPYRSVLAVPVSHADTGLPLQGVPPVDGPAEDPVGRGTEGKREGEAPVQDPVSADDEDYGAGALSFCSFL